MLHIYTVIQVSVYYLHFYIISKILVANYASIAKSKMIIQKIQYTVYREQRVVYFSLCSLLNVPSIYTSTTKNDVSSNKKCSCVFLLDYRHYVYFEYLQTYNVTK